MVNSDDDERLEIPRRRLLGSVATLGAAGAVGGMGSRAYFSNEEQFANNQLVAGELDMKVGWEEHYSDWSSDEAVNGVTMERSPGGFPVTFADAAAKDLFMSATREERYPDAATHEALRDGTNDPCEALADVPDQLDSIGGDRPVVALDDVKPGDFGELTFDFVLCDNPGWIWLDGHLLDANERNRTEPERRVDETDETVELLENVIVTIWYDDGDNVLEESETLVTEREAGKPDSSTSVELSGDKRILMRDTLGRVLDRLSFENGIRLDGRPESADSMDCHAETPSVHRIGFLWELPADVDNAIQTDAVRFDLGFYTEQCRHNSFDNDVVADVNKLREIGAEFALIRAAAAYALLADVRRERLDSLKATVEDLESSAIRMELLAIVDAALNANSRASRAAETADIVASFDHQQTVEDELRQGLKRVEAADSLDESTRQNLRSVFDSLIKARANVLQESNDIAEATVTESLRLYYLDRLQAFRAIATKIRTSGHSIDLVYGDSGPFLTINSPIFGAFTGGLGFSSLLAAGGSAAAAIGSGPLLIGGAAVAGISIAYTTDFMGVRSAITAGSAASTGPSATPGIQTAITGDIWGQIMATTSRTVPTPGEWLRRVSQYQFGAPFLRTNFLRYLVVQEAEDQFGEAVDPEDDAAIDFTEDLIGLTADLLVPGLGPVSEALVTTTIEYLDELAAGLDSSDGESPQPTLSAWPRFQFDDQHTGYNPDSAGITSDPKRVWRLDTTTQVATPPVVDGEDIYIVDFDNIVYSVAASSGEINWQTPLDFGVLATRLTLASGVLYFGSNNEFFAVDTSTGEIIWRTPSEYSTAPIVRDGMLYKGGYGDGSGAIEALDTTTGDTAWSVTVDDFPIAPAVENGVLYSGEPGSGDVFALNISSREISWSASTGGRLAGPATVADGTVFVCSDAVYAFDASSGDEVWNMDVSGSNSPAVDADSVYVTGDSGRLHALDPSSGAKQWTVSANTSFARPPSVDDGAVYYGAAGVRMYAHDSATGDELWTYDLGASILDEPASLNDELFVVGYYLNRLRSQST